MEGPMRAVEVTGTVDEGRQLQLDNSLPISGPVRVRVIVLYPAEEDLEESDWLRAAARNAAFNFLKEPEEDIYGLADGKPCHDQE